MKKSFLIKEGFFHIIFQIRRKNMQPLADKLRPETIDDMVGQSHIIGKGKIINKLIENKTIPNMILYGPPGTGKTTLANIIDRKSVV